MTHNPIVPGAVDGKVGKRRRALFAVQVGKRKDSSLLRGPTEGEFAHRKDHLGISDIS